MYFKICRNEQNIINTDSGAILKKIDFDLLFE